jgi:pyruvate/2-oxoacid:ferredoxin oxidoreductase beta subunit/Pyruvate/2-oxoacid:ferredoxin oxidoreductase gamma subunit
LSETAIATYLDPATLPVPFCPGCGHTTVLNRLNEALVSLQLDPRRVVVVTDIGCSGLSDRHVITHAVHGLHGRSITYASGLKLADPGLTVIVIMGDGGCGIGGAHLLAAARRNIGITVLVLNNMNFGMTGGQHSVTTPGGAITSTTRAGNLERPLDICATVGVNGAALAARATMWDKDLTALLAQAITTNGFAVVDIWDLCAAYFAPANRLNKAAMMDTLAHVGMKTGVLYRSDAPEYSAAYRQQSAALTGQAALPHRPLAQTYESTLARKVSLVLAGSAGGKVRSTATAMGRAAVLSGLWASQRDDYPVTVMSGHSLSELILSPQPIEYAAIGQPDILAVLTSDGLKAARSQAARLAAGARLYWNAALGAIETNAEVIALDVARCGLQATKENLAMLAAGAIVQRENFYPLAALVEAINLGQPPEIARANVAALEAGAALVTAA